MKTINIVELIPEGKENAKRAFRLAEELHMDERTVRSMIHEARRNGFLILSGDAGYWRSDNLSELKQFYKRMRAMGIGTLAAAKTARLKIRELEEGEDNASK